MRRTAVTNGENAETMSSITSAEFEQMCWSDVVDMLERHGEVSVTHDGERQAVIVSPARFSNLKGRQTPTPTLAQSERLEDLRKRFEARLASLNQPGAEQRFDDVFARPGKLHGKVMGDDTD